MQTNKIILDTDAGHDDALAILLLLGSPRQDILTVTTVAGNSTIENVTRNACAILDLAGRRDIPVHSGSPAPLERDLIKAVVHGESGLDGLDMHMTHYETDGLAPDKIVELVRKNPNEIRIVTIGPLTNIARAFQMDPHLPSLIRDIVIMGGAIDVCGNKNRVAEFNIFVDPEAADIVMRAPVRKIMIPLDPCNEIILPLDFFNALEGTPLHEPMISMMAHFINGIGMDEGTEGALVYDAIAAYYLIDPDAFTLAEMDIVIETRGEHTSGMTIAEKRIKAPKNPNVAVAVKVDAEKFRDALITALRNLGAKSSQAA